MKKKSKLKPPQHLDEAFSQINQELLEMFVKKHKDYGKENILDTEELGILFRVNDKIARLKNLMAKEKKPANESIQETWTDIAVYAVIAIMYRRGWFQDLELPVDSKNGAISKSLASKE